MLIGSKLINAHPLSAPEAIIVYAIFIQCTSDISKLILSFPIICLKDFNVDYNFLFTLKFQIVIYFYFKTINLYEYTHFMQNLTPEVMYTD